ncbi:uncharacterized protein LOC116338382 [Contarinia nasturtii]|uniref:uncharacterized protein LOC116338382 n=1 Tax=Contarinia nasturtii TaxID=265458 RepID=UPI0012D39FC3|nr:uncharacterized protein LOC116338382 [Contarinia nasturtii]
MKMSCKIVLIVGCFILITTLNDKYTTAETVVPKLYEELGCKENKESSGPKRFECPDFSTYAKDKCHLNGKVFNINEKIDSKLLPSCQPSCICDQRDNERAYFKCAHNDCPEFLGSTNFSCLQQYDKVDDCCRAREVCDQARIIQDACVFEGKNYGIGEKMYPKDDSCYRCLCGEGFTNKTSLAENPHCQRVNCHIELNQFKDIIEGCVPIYYKTPTCCPIAVKCPAKDDAVELGFSSEYANDAKYSCKFGDLTLKYGEQLKSSNKCLKCECSTPPYLTCVQLHS